MTNLQVLFKEISWFLLRSINDSYKKGILSITQRYGIITLLPKGNKPRQFLKNWRTISLLNVSYKLVSSCIAERIKSTLSTLIHENQKGFISGRYIGENIRLMYGFIHLTEKEKIPGMLLTIDFENAFDSVSHTFLKSCLISLTYTAPINPMSTQCQQQIYASDNIYYSFLCFLISAVGMHVHQTGHRYPEWPNPARRWR